MLNKAERFQVLRMIRFWCKLGWLPVEVDLSKWEMRPRASTWKCHFCFFVYAVHTFYKLCASVYWLNIGVPLHEAVIQLILTVTMVVTVYWYYVVYIKNPQFFGFYLSMTLTGKQIGKWKDKIPRGHVIIILCVGYEAAGDTQKARSWSCRLKEYTVQDIFAMSLPYTFLLSILTVMLTLIFNPSIKYMLYAAIPLEHQTIITFGILLFEELRMLIAGVSMMIPILTAQVLSFDLVRNKLQQLIDSMQR